jgi:hypothetical protein
MVWQSFLAIATYLYYNTQMSPFPKHVYSLLTTTTPQPQASGGEEEMDVTQPLAITAQDQR